MEDLPVTQRIQFYEDRKNSIVCVRRADGSIGGGFFIRVDSKCLVVTAAHLVHDHDSYLTVICADKNIVVAHIVYIQRDLDVALLEVEESEIQFKCLELYQGQLFRGAEIHLIGHPGLKQFTYNIGRVACVERTCGNIYRNEWLLTGTPPFPTVQADLVDDFRGLASSLRLISAKNLHGGGRAGGTGSPFLNGAGHVIGLYSFTFRDEDYGIHVEEIQKVITMFKNTDKGKGKDMDMGKRTEKDKDKGNDKAKRKGKKLKFI